MDGLSTVRHTLLNLRRGLVMQITMPFGQREIYDTDGLRALNAVFENAWASIEYNFDPGSREAARLKLAKTNFQLAATGVRDLLELRCRAIGAMQVRSHA